MSASWKWASREEAWRQPGIHLCPSLSSSIILLYVFALFSSQFLSLFETISSLPCTFPWPAGSLMELKQGCLLADTTRSLMLPLDPVLLGSGSLLCCGFHSFSLSLMKLCPLFSRARLLGDLAVSQPVDAWVQCLFQAPYPQSSRRWLDPCTPFLNKPCGPEEPMKAAHESVRVQVGSEHTRDP